MAEEDRKKIDVEAGSPEQEAKDMRRSEASSTKSSESSLEKEEEELKKAVEAVTESNKKIDDDYDERIRKLDMKRKLEPTDEKAEEDHAARILMLKEKYEDLKSRISQLRKSGKDPLIPSLMIKSLPAKIKMADVTREKRDFDQVEIMIMKVGEELDEVQKEKMLDVKKEIEEKLKAELESEGRRNEERKARKAR
ncbi:hypothetical protein JW711_01250 [Candidatus Woesearchaeota archaeon]|nr:hypothetical protein [Candidatus Woesearchaeota archaeon]